MNIFSPEYLFPLWGVSVLLAMPWGYGFYKQYKLIKSATGVDIWMGRGMTWRLLIGKPIAGIGGEYALDMRKARMCLIGWNLTLLPVLIVFFGSAARGYMKLG